MERAGKFGAIPIPSYAIFKTAIGWCGAVMAAGILRRLLIGYGGRQQLIRRIRNTCGDGITLNHTGAMREVVQKLTRYCAGERVSLSGMAMDWSSLTPFEQKVLSAVAKIPYGCVDTYGGIARKIGAPRSARAVGNALAKNPFPLLIPCHRIIRGDGGMGGFSAPNGIKLKKRILYAEMTPFKHVNAP